LESFLVHLYHNALVLILLSNSQVSHISQEAMELDLDVDILLRRLPELDAPDLLDRIDDVDILRIFRELALLKRRESHYILNVEV